MEDDLYDRFLQDCAQDEDDLELMRGIREERVREGYTPEGDTTFLHWLAENDSPYESLI